MLKEFVDRILELEKPQTYTDSAGVERFIDSGRVIGPAPLPVTEGSSLASVVEQVQRTQQPIIEVGFTSITVSVITIYNKCLFTQTRHKASPILPEQFPFGRAMDVESFIIHASDFFVRDANFQSLVKSISTITDVQETVVSDDGVSQTVTFKSGINRKDSGRIEPYITLRVIRTFREVEQPEVTYLLRIGKGREGAPTVTLHEASGYDWKIRCTDSVFNYLREQLTDKADAIWIS